MSDTYMRARLLAEHAALMDTRDVRYRVRVLKNGVAATELLWPEGDDPVVYWDKDGDIKAAMNGSFYKNAAADLLADELQPVLILNGTEYPLGVFRAATVTTDATQYSPTVSVEAYDRCWRLNCRRTESVLHYAAGTPYISVIEGLLTECGISLRIVVSSAATLQTDREDWEVGTDYLTIVNQLLSEINYAPIWFDVDGMARVEPYQSVDAKRIEHVYGDMGAPEVFNPALSNSKTETDIFSKPNVFICVCSNPEIGTPMTATAVNKNASSSTSVFRRGMRIAQRYIVNNIASQAELQAYANKLMNESMFATQTVTFETFAEGGHGIGDIISINNRDIGGVYEETAWSLTLAAGATMKHTAKRAVSTV